MVTNTDFDNAAPVLYASSSCSRLQSCTVNFTCLQICVYHFGRVPGANRARGAEVQNQSYDAPKSRGEGMQRCNTRNEALMTDHKVVATMLQVHGTGCTNAMNHFQTQYHL